MPNGMIKINQGITIRGSHYYVGDSEISSDSGNTQIAHYYLPSGDIVAVDRQSGRIVNVIAFDGRSYDLDAITFISAEGKQTIQFKLEKFNVIYSYDSNEVLKEVFIEINQEHLINGGVTIYVDIEPSQMSELGWTTDGTRVYYKNAFLQDGDEVRPIFLGMNGDNYLYLLEPLSQDRPFYHVVEFEVDGDNYTFINGYTYEKNQLLSAAVGELDRGRGMSLNQAKQQASGVLNSHELKSSFSADSTPQTVADLVVGALQGLLTDNWRFTVKADFTTTEKTVYVNEGGEQREETITILDDIYIEVNLIEVAPDGETGETALIYHNYDVEYETDLTGEELTFTSEMVTGTKSKASAVGVEFTAEDLGTSRSGAIFANKSGGTTSLVVKNGSYEFDLVYNEYYQAYLVSSGDYEGNEKKAYEELLGKFFVLSSDESNITVFELELQGTGPVDDAAGKLNGAYRNVAGGYLFVENAASTNPETDILYLLDRAAVVTRMAGSIRWRSKAML